MADFKKNDEVIIKGDARDFTDHLNGMKGIVYANLGDDCIVYVPGAHANPWFVWKENLTHA